MSSGEPSAHDANDGDASRPLSFIASAMRSSAGKNWSRSNTPSLRIGGDGIIPTSVIRSSAAPLAPRVVHEVRQQDVLAARQRIGVDADQAEQAGDVALDLVGDRLGVAHVGGYLQRPDDVQRHARLRAGRVDREVGLLAQRTDVGAAQTPAGEPLGPQRRLARGELVGRLTGVARLRLVDPRPEVGGSEGGKREAEVGEVALRIDREHRAARPAAPPR